MWVAILKFEVNVISTELWCITMAVLCNSAAQVCAGSNCNWIGYCNVFLGRLVTVLNDHKKHVIYENRIHIVL